MEKLRENSERSKWSVFIISSIIVFEVIIIGLNFIKYNILSNYFDGVDLDEDYLLMVEDIEGIFSIIYFLLTILSAILFIRWFRRAYYNLHLLTQNLNYEEGWAAGAWFVPFINLYRPYQMMNELFLKTKEVLSINKIQFESKNSLSGIWWFFWILSGVIGNILFRYSLDITTLEEVENLAMITIISSTIGIFSAFFAIKVIKNYTYLESKLNSKNQNELIERF